MIKAKRGAHVIGLSLLVMLSASVVGAQNPSASQPLLTTRVEPKEFGRVEVRFLFGPGVEGVASLLGELKIRISTSATAALRARAIPFGTLLAGAAALFALLYALILWMAP